MCGIFGKVNADPQRPVEAALIERACAAIAHRGPDGQGLFRQGPVGLGHRRLAIIDVAGGTQPMSTEDGRLWITYNGEVYNFRELRRELAVLGYRFRTESDTEVVLYAYAAWGPKCVERFNGMFAFGLWDAKERVLFLARDRLGIKPLYYHVGAHGVTFASDLPALAADPDVSRRLDPQALSDYLSLGYVLAPKTIFRDVRKLPPGHALLCGARDTRSFSYWDLASRVLETRSALAAASEAALTEELRARLARSVASQMVSDVPVGAFLSGGVDSSAVVGYMQSGVGEPVRTFSLGFADPSFSELDFARRAARHLATNHCDLVVTPDLDDLVPRLARAIGEPLADSSLLPTYLVAQLARRSVKVALSGDGGDEGFAGYETYVADRLHGAYRRVPAWLRRWVVEPAVRALPVSYRKVSFDYKAKQFIAAGDASLACAHYTWRLLFTDAEKRALLPPDVLAEIGEYDPATVVARHFQDLAGADPLARAQYADIRTWLADDILPKVDRASMAHGVETRVPLLDHELIEFALALPSARKIRRFEQKHLLKAAVAPMLPREIVYRKKAGFGAPVGPWFRRAPLRGLFERAVLRGGGMVPLAVGPARALLDEHVAGRRDNGYRLWCLLMLSVWAGAHHG
jgi:asparagine synthase (glutamine-hydrolysing)